ncbi:carboxypeptidase regulatory-like domain-containing protein [Corallococcus sp. AB030]|uniref:carboxypeptidase-like regulatory domain-containing protein n=1 Tax=Corallococcus sp. AB030 TaxID=2316716 RepID=UPI000ED14DC5|nr:carboxypeptidase-like regulatory domain-containing protein [Corallococcus sp. AB030]RKI03011.1 carboxypeptidase regulatory-like domain-containing protein [Corallococcus sp. AB030]
MRRGKQAIGFTVAVVVGLLLLGFFVLREHGSAPGPASQHSTKASRFVTGPHAKQAPATGSPRITGVVRDARGPVAGVRVFASRAEPEVTLSERSCPPSEDAPAESPPRLMECWNEAFDELVDQIGKREGEAPTVAETLSAEDGTFALDGLPDGTVTLQASSGLRVAMLPDVATGQQDVVLVLDEGLFFEGAVLDDVLEGKPITGARITVFTREHTRFFPATSGADGRFRIGPVPPADHGILITAPGFSPLLEMEADPLKDTFVLDRPAKFAGTVVTAKGAPAPGISVRLHTPSLAPESRTTLTDARGRFSFPSSEGVLAQLFAETPARDGFATLGTEPREDVVLTLGPGMFLQGTVSDESGNPIPGARVEAFRLDEDAPSQRRKTVTDARGHYRLGPLFRLPHFVAARAERHVDRTEEHEEPEQTEVSLDFTLPRAVSVEGVLVDEADQPLAGLEVQLRPGVAPRLSPYLGVITDYTVTDEAGRFLLDAKEAGAAWLDVSGTNFIPQRVNVTLPSSKLRLVLRQGASVAVTVLSATGAPVRDARVTLWQRDARGAADHAGGTDARGQVTLQGVPPGRYVAEALAPGRAVDVHASQSLEVLPGEAPSVTLRMEEGRTLRGVAVTSQGRPLPGVHLRAKVLDADRPLYRYSGEGYRTRAERRAEGVHTDTEGHFLLRSLSASRYELTASLQDHYLDARASQGVRAAEYEAAVVDRDTTEVRLVMRRIPHVRGRVVAEGGARLASFVVNDHEYTDPDGRFDQQLIEVSGPQRIVVQARGFAPVDRTVTPDGESDLDLGTLTLTRGRTLKVFLREAATGAPYTGRVRDDSGQETTVAVSYHVEEDGVVDGPSFRAPRQAVPSKDGSLLLEQVPTTACTLEVDTEFHLPLRVTVGAEVEHLTLSLEKGARVTGHVRDAQGQPVKAQLIFTRPDGSDFRRKPGPGDFTLAVIPPGLYTVDVWPEERTNEVIFQPRVVRIPSSGDVTLEFDALGAGTTVTLRLPEDVDTAFLLSGRAPTPNNSRAFDYLIHQQHPLTEWTGTSVTFRRVPAGHYTVIAGNRGQERIHREELDVPAEGTVSRDVKPVWMPLAR